MMKLVIFGAIALVLGLGGTTGVMVMTAPKLPPGADSLLAARADSTAAAHHATAEGGAPHVTPAPGEGAHAAEGAVAADAPAGEAIPSAHGEAAAPATEATTAAHVPAIEPVRVPPPSPMRELSAPGEPDAETYKQVGTILMNMKPVEAAKIIGYLNDTQVEGLLRSMSPRNAASVLSQLPSERAAALSRRLLVPAREAKP